jgi:DNA polymerase I-like protein with 3'-5' exonuclease and polymerase domains
LKGHVFVQAQKKAERQALAFAVLGTAADIMKSILLDLHAVLSEARASSPACAASMLCVCANEILLECPAEQTSQLLQA